MKKSKTADSNALLLDGIIPRSSEKKEAQCTVVKRSGALVPFRRERIHHAIEAAFRDTKKISLPSILDPDVKDAVEALFKVSVKSVNIVNVKGGAAIRFGRSVGKRPSWKKAYVTLVSGQQINMQ